ncbi:hypothetical protein [Runella aurantiaca]|uniref:Capsule assembly Wzi family protein n=1 Tax=Runella aurantiaca TaxID=2282308 RepID=A0A369I0G7_9BACT|nr:hypothetical protein [Runella aurantiaca]RDB03259.1 hypothetical protein DVG78_24815 [Runella aurantiaca]
MSFRQLLLLMGLQKQGRSTEKERCFLRGSFYGFLWLLVLQIPSFAQSQFVPLNDDYYHLIDRFEIRRGRLSEDFHIGVKPFQRKAVVSLLDSIEADRTMPLNDIDYFNLHYLRQDNWEWSTNKTPMSQKRFMKRFYERPSDFYSIQNKDLDLHLSPVTHLILGGENSSKDYLWLTARGVEMRGVIGKKLGFYTYVTDTQGMFGKYVRDYTLNVREIYLGYPLYVLPGESFVKSIRTYGVDFISARGYITFNPIKQINLQFGHDKNVMGSGYRSMLLSDWSSPYLFLKMTTQLGRFQYTNLWANMLYNQVGRRPEEPINKKFAAIHHLSINLSKNISLGIYEAEVFGRENNTFDLNYLNPIIFYRYLETYLGSSDNALLGVDFRWNFLKHFGFYSQFMLDEFKTSEYFGKKGSWGKKYAFQAGLKYVDALGIKNLDLQAEYNVARPFTYSHKNGFNNYVHYDQSLAHPLGANFWEVVGLLRYQPTRRLTVYGTFTYSKRGVDSDSWNYGSNIYRPYDDFRVRDEGNFIGQGTPVNTTFADLRMSYMLKHNFFIDGRLMIRQQESPLESQNLSTTSATFGVRLNIPYRQQVF